MNNISKSTYTILIVDDMPENIAILNQILSEYYDTKIVTEGKEALKLASTDPVPDLILLDIVLPGMNGYQICKELKKSEITRDIPVIFVTSMDQTIDELEGFEAGAVDYITKPVSPHKVLARVKTQLTLKDALLNLKKQNIELTKAAKLREDVERIGRHDLKLPLNSVLTYSQILLDKETEESKIKFLKKIERSGLRMLNMINRSLDWFRMEQGFYKLNPNKVNIVPLIYSALDENKRLAERKDISVHCFLQGKRLDTESTCFVYGEELLCYSMLSNLIVNAYEASPEHESIQIVLSGKEEVEIRISNKGEIPHEIRKVFFDKYTTAGKIKGTGIGTYSAWLIARIHGGSISFISGKEEGTTLFVKLPGC